MEKENKKIECFVCGKPCLCECISGEVENKTINFCSLECYNKSTEDMYWEFELGEYAGHFAWCHIGGEFEKKHKELVKGLNFWRDRALNSEKIMDHIINKILENRDQGLSLRKIQTGEWK